MQHVFAQLNKYSATNATTLSAGLSGVRSDYYLVLDNPAPAFHISLVQEAHYLSRLHCVGPIISPV